MRNKTALVKCVMVVAAETCPELNPRAPAPSRLLVPEISQLSMSMF